MAGEPLVQAASLLALIYRFVDGLQVIACKLGCWRVAVQRE